MNWTFPTLTTTALGAGALAVRKLFTAPRPPELPGCAHPAPPAPPPLPPEPGMWQRLSRLLRSVFVRQRGERAWVMLVGSRGAGKTSLAASAEVSAGRHDHGVRRPHLPGATCHGFPQGVLVDADGALTPARWRRLLNQLELMRPQRPLDGLMLAVSAATLARPETAQVLADADATRRQLLEIQQRYQWVLPVYVVVTQCDRLADGPAYAEALGAIPATDMVGWSAPEVGDYAGAQRWSDQAFDQLADRFRQCQLLQAGAAPDQEAPYQRSDAAYLLPYGLQGLRAPLAAWLELAFRPGTTQQGFMMRGIYFTGAAGAPPAKPADPRADVQGIADVVSRKALAERHLAEPTRRGRGARNLIQRALLWVLGTLVAALALTLAIETALLKSDLDQLDLSLRAIAQSAAMPPPVQCLERGRMVDLLERIERAPLPDYFPWSLVDRRARDQSARLVAARALDQVVLTALECKLTERGANLGKPLAGAPDSRLSPDGFMAAARSNLLGYLDQVLALEQNHARLRQLGAPNGAADPAAATLALNALLVDLYGLRSNGAVSGGAWPDWLVRILATAGVKLSGDTVPGAAAGRADSHKLIYQSLRFVTRTMASDPPRAALQANITRLQSQLPDYLSGQLTDGAAALAQFDKGASGLQAPALLDGARQGYAWLSWVRNTLVRSTPASNPCQDIASGIDRRKAALADFGYELAVPYSADQCYASLMTLLARQSLPGYGPVVSSDNGRQPLKMNPLLVPELNGLGALLAQDFMQITSMQPFQCLRQEVSWQPETIQRARDFARDYQLFARTQGVSAALRAPLFDRVARRQLELVMSDTLSAAQSPAAASLGRAGLAAAGADARLSRLSADFATAAAPLAGVVQLYQQMGMAGSATDLSNCVRDHASDGLSGVGELAESGRLYMPLAGAPGAAPFDLGGAASVQSYLDSQVSRVQVLAGYAAPYAQVLQNTPAVDDARKTPSQGALYWNNTIKQLNQYLAHDNSGEAGKLHALIASQVPDGDAGACPPAKAPDAGGNDLFSARRLALQLRLDSRCASRAQAQLVKDYGILSDAFNARLAGRYPFGALAADDAPTAEVRQFYADYGALLSSVRASYAKLDVATLPAGAVQRVTMQKDFLNRLDDLGKALLPALTSGVPLRVAVTFYARPQDTQGSEQLVVWTLSSGAVTVGAPNRQSGALDWPLGQALSFDLEWADRSPWRPLADRTQRDLQISGTSAQFGYTGDWALLRMVELHRLPDSGDASGAMLLQFQVPLAPLGAAGARPTGQARVYLNLVLGAKDAKTPLKLPLSFPHFAPR